LIKVGDSLGWFTLQGEENSNIYTGKTFLSPFRSAKNYSCLKKKYSRSAAVKQNEN